MFHMPMSSPMMTTMFGRWFCARASVAKTQSVHTSSANNITLDVPINSGYERKALARSAIERAEVSDGYERTGNWKRGAAIGAGIGFAVGGLAGLAVRGLEGENSQTEPLVRAAAGAIVGGIAGAIIGTGPKKERWRELPIESLQVGVRTEGVSLAIAVRL